MLSSRSSFTTDGVPHRRPLTALTAVAVCEPCGGDLSRRLVYHPFARLTAVRGAVGGNLEPDMIFEFSLETRICV